MCLNGTDPALTADLQVTDCPHLEVGKRQRVNFCGCCMHRMCDMCAAAHPMPTPEQEKMMPYPCHLMTRLPLFDRERNMEAQMVARFNLPAPPRLVDVIV